MGGGESGGSAARTCQGCAGLGPAERSGSFHAMTDGAITAGAIDHVGSLCLHAHPGGAMATDAQVLLEVAWTDWTASVEPWQPGLCRACIGQALTHC